MTDALDKELERFNELLPTLTGSDGKYALIYQGDLKGVYEAYSDALAAGYAVAGLNPFLVKKIASAEFIAYFTRDVDGACHI